MKISASVKTLWNRSKHATASAAPDHTVPAINTTAHAAPAARYGEQASLITLLQDCFTSLLSKPPKLKSLLLVLALAIPATIAIVSQGLHSASENLLASRTITVFVASKHGSEALRLAETLAANSHIRTAVPRSINLQNKTLLAIDVQPSETLNKNQLNVIVDELNSHTSVDYVVADEAWLDRNINAVGIAKILRIVSLVTAALATSVPVFLLTRANLPLQQSEASVLQQIGASRKMVLKPLIIRCTLLGFFAAGVGILLAWTMVTSLPNIIDMSTYQLILPDSFPAVRLISLLALAILSSVMTVKLFLKIY